MQLKACDAGKKSDMERLFKEAKDGDGPLRGVVHAAGILDRCPLAELDAGRLEKAPKES